MSIGTYFHYLPTGEILCSGTCPEQEIEIQVPLPGAKVAKGVADWSADYYDVSTGRVIAKPPQPSAFHQWDWPSKSWIPELETARTTRKREVDAERERVSILPLAFDNKLLDADTKAQKNLSDKLQEVRERLRLNLPMPVELLVWRGADNVTHTFSDLQSYHDWLSGFTIAIAERGTRFYMRAWQHKYNIDQLSSIEKLLNYSISFD